MIQDFKYIGKAYQIRVGDALFQAKQKVAPGRTVLQAAMLAADTTMQVGCRHILSDASCSPTGYVKVDNEVIQYSSDAGVSATAYQSARAEPI